MVRIYHFSHRKHPLTLRELEVDDGQEKVDCYGCKQPISSGSTTHFYCCSVCEVFLHKSCAELPLEITHPMHSEHPLQLVAKPSYLSKSFPPLRSCECDICKRKWTGFTYHCSKCKFDLDVICAQLEGTFKHPGHRHPLKYQSRSALFECDACDEKVEDESYYCIECPFWIHKTCGLMQSNPPFKPHPHPLSLAYDLPGNYLHYNLECDICRESLSPGYWVYYCDPCRYFIHLQCMTSKSQEDGAAEANFLRSTNEFASNSISLPPVENLSPLLIQHFYEQNNLPQVKPLSEIKHFSHEHPLVLSSVQEDYYEFTEDDQETTCSACVEPISGSCYTCALCNYFIHSYCANLPKDLSYSDHPEHKLSLYSHPEFYRISECSKCKYDCNGFFYKCRECDFLVDIKCALLPCTIKHEAHDHLLFLVRGESSREFCNACNNTHKDNFFRCKNCPYKLARECATSPKIVRHRWDKHPLTLSFPPYYYHPNEFTCDICEEEIHRKYWLYHCRSESKCDNSFHLDCVPRFAKWRNMKFGGKVAIDYHPHPLTFARKAKYMSSCDKCHKDLKNYTAFECETCYFNICRFCVSDIIDSSSKLEERREEYTNL